MALMRGKGYNFGSEGECGATGPALGPGAHKIPEKPFVTGPSGLVAPKASFAQRQYLPAAIDEETRHALEEKRRSSTRLYAESLTPHGQKMLREERQKHLALRRTRSEGILTRKLSLDEERDQGTERAQLARRERIAGRPPGVGQQQ